MPSEFDAVRVDFSYGVGVGIGGFDHTFQCYAWDAVLDCEVALMIVAVEPGDDVFVAFDELENFFGVPSVVDCVWSDGMMREDDDFLILGGGGFGGLFEPGELFIAECAVPGLRIN